MEEDKKRKYLWCKKCQDFPSSVIEMYDYAKQVRVWNGEDYEGQQSQELGESVLFCGICESSLEEK